MGAESSKIVEAADLGLDHVPEGATVGVKGSDVFTLDGVEDARVALSAILVRGKDASTIESQLKKILSTGSLVWEEDAFLLAFQTRAIRGGKGERLIAQHMFRTLYAERPDLTLALLDLIPHYGCWKDLFVLAEASVAGSKLEKKIMEISKKQMLLDLATGENEKISLFAKWAPREGDPLAKKLAYDVWTGPKNVKPSGIMASYRKKISALNRKSNTTEIKMCGGNWKDIQPATVPGRCLKLHTKAFLDESKTGTIRHPDITDRKDCREHFQEHFKKAAKGEVKLNGAQTIYPHELIRTLWNTLDKFISSEEKDSIRAIWNSMVKAAKEGGGLGRSIAMCDFSGSMSGIPIEVSRAIGLLISEVTTEEFAGTMLTFDSTPKWLQFEENDIVDKVNRLRDLTIGQGLSTDFQKAMDLILENLKEKKVRAGEEPQDLIVLTDMAWDLACQSEHMSIYTGNKYNNINKTKSWETHIQMIRQAFKSSGEDLWGEGNGWKPPRIVIWNLSSICNDMHAQAKEEGVVMLSGWSPSLFKVLQAKGADGVLEAVTPLATLRLQLDDSMYDLVKDRIKEWRELTGPLE